jgi:hypothetical protein
MFSLQPSLGPLGRTLLLGPGDPLLSGLVSWWNLDETSGTRYDSVGSNDLSDYNSVGYTTGKIGNAASCVAASSERLQCDADLWSGGDWSACAWIDHLGSTQQIILASATVIGGTTYSALVYKHSINYWWVTLYDSVSGASTINWNLASGGTGWRFGVWGYNASTKKPWLSVDGAAKVYGGTALTNGIRSGGGNTVGYSGSAGHTDLDADLMGAWDRILPDEEIITLHNSGLGWSP